MDIQQTQSQTLTHETISILSYTSVHEDPYEEGELPGDDDTFNAPHEAHARKQSPHKMETRSVNTKSKKEIKLTPSKKERTESLQDLPQTYAQAAQSLIKKSESFEITANRKRRVTYRSSPDEKSSAHQHSNKAHKTSHEVGT